MIKGGDFERAHAIQDLWVKPNLKFGKNDESNAKIPSQTETSQSDARTRRYESTAFKILGLGHFDVCGFCHNVCGGVSLR